MVIAAGRVDWSRVRGPVLLAGDTHQVPEMQRIAAALPDPEQATILVEAFSAVQVHRVKVPDGVGVTWLVRDRDDAVGAFPTARTRGQRLATGVRAWLSEWACATGDDDVPPCTVWLAARTPPHIVRMTRAVLAAGRAPRRDVADSGDHPSRAGRRSAHPRQEP